MTIREYRALDRKDELKEKCYRIDEVRLYAKRVD